MKQNIPLQNKYLQPVGSPIDDKPQQKFVPWEFGIKQGMQLKKIRSSTGYFKKLSAGVIGTIQSISGGSISLSTINTSTFDTGTITNSSFQGTISQPIASGGTFTNPTINTGTFNTSLISTGTFNTGVIGTPAITGGTYTAPILNGTVTYPVTAGTQALSANNMFQLQTLSGSVILVVRSGGTNFFFSSSGTF